MDISYIQQNKEILLLILSVGYVLGAVLGALGQTYSALVGILLILGTGYLCGKKLGLIK